ncbi:MAG TPA: hypothetical protein VEI83_14855 [Acidimicrobiales bacterium]|nr:hypothetical protein [Acidimicrobiales bacterium]
MQRWTRRQFLGLSAAGAAGTAAAAFARSAAPWALAGSDASGTAGAAAGGGFLTAAQRGALAAAAARLVPAAGPGDWSAADLGAVDYVDNLLAGFDRDPADGGIYGGGPYRFPSAEGAGLSTLACSAQTCVMCI